MIKKSGATYTLIGHIQIIEGEGDTDKLLKNKVKFSLRNNLKIVFCIGESKKQKKNNQTQNVLKKQLSKVLEKKFNSNNIIVAYEPIWSIGTGELPTTEELNKTIKFIKKILKRIFKSKNPTCSLWWISRW